MKIKEDEKIYIALNKPKGYVCALKDNLHPTVLDLIKEPIKGLHIVGRLDKDTTGLIILTNDGKYTHNATHPKKHVSKVYEVTLKNDASDNDVKIIESGMSIDYGKTKLLLGKVKLINRKRVELEIKEGKFHQVKKMFASLKNEVLELNRIEFDGLKLNEMNLPIGKYKKIDVKNQKSAHLKNIYNFNMKKNIVVLGGGTGLPNLLRGIKYIDGINLCAVVTVADSGGSTGILSKHFDIPAVGDLRRVIASLSREREALEESMEFRIKGTNSDLDGHTVGNLLLASQILMKNDFIEGIKATTKMLNVEGTILPVSAKFNHLCAEVENGDIIEGEDKIGKCGQRIKRVFYNDGHASAQVIDAINKADYIIFGIGSLYTSLIANLIYPEINEALKKTNAKVIYFANVFTQHGETDNMKLSDHIRAIEDHTHKGVIDRVIVADTSGVDNKIIDIYAKDKQSLVDIDLEVKKEDLLKVRKNEKTGKFDFKHDEKKIEMFFRRFLNEEN